MSTRRGLGGLRGLAPQRVGRPDRNRAQHHDELLHVFGVCVLVQGQNSHAARVRARQLHCRRRDVQGKGGGRRLHHMGHDSHVHGRFVGVCAPSHPWRFVCSTPALPLGELAVALLDEPSSAQVLALRAVETSVDHLPGHSRVVPPRRRQVADGASGALRGGPSHNGNHHGFLGASRRRTPLPRGQGPVQWLPARSSLARVQAAGGGRYCSLDHRSAEAGHV
mmetsp:Transcript_61579/g.156475  ORF Transcript_61579/g.156475 Transcript_61579/m.156475 type:complete len:222 (+) Transcript_61579:161-826(+)